MPTKNERLSLVNDGEEVTAVKAPPPGLIRESKVVAVPGSGPIAGARVDQDNLPTPVPVVRATPARTAGAVTGSGRVAFGRATPATGSSVSSTLSLPRPPLPPVAAPPATAPPTGARSTPAQPAARVPTPSAPSPTPSASLPTPSAPRPAVARASVPEPLTATLVTAYHRPVVDLVPVSPGAGAMSFAARAMFSSPARSRTGLYAVLLGLLVGGAGLVAWRHWSGRPGRVEISTTPADAIITVGNEAVAQHSPFTLERPPGTYEISVSRVGYQHTHRTIELLAGQEVVLSIGLAAASTAGAPPAPDVVPPARPGPGQSVLHHAPAAVATAAAHHPSASAPAPAPAPGAHPDPGIDAMLARAHPLRDLSGAKESPTPAPAAAASPAAPAAPAAIDINEESGPAPVAHAPATAAPAAPAAASATSPASAEIAGARTVPGRIAKAQLAIDPNGDEYRVTLPPSLARAEMKLSAVVKICVSAQGKVADVRLLKSADPAVDAQIPSVLSRWRFRPLLADGHAVPFCYVTQYEINER